MSLYRNRYHVAELYKSRYNEFEPILRDSTSLAIRKYDTYDENHDENHDENYDERVNYDAWD